MIQPILIHLLPLVLCFPWCPDIFSNDFKAGFAAADITPPVGWRSAGDYTELISTGVINPFMTQAMANDLDFYIPMQRAFKEGNYEPTTCPLEPGSGERLVAAAVKLLNELEP